jgi:DNA modification methylase
MTELLRTINASAHDIPLDDCSVHCIVTSPPYWGLRAYKGNQLVEWPSITYRMNEWTPEITVNAWRGGLGMEPDPPAFIGHLILCLREWRRILRDDGTLWVNLGDSYAGSGGAHTLDHANPGISRSASRDGYTPDGGRGMDKTKIGLKRKDMVGIPWLFAMAARADGWHLRSDVVWSKPNPMPESVTDRPTKAHEYMFLLSKQIKYFYDADAVRERALYGEEHANKTTSWGTDRKHPNKANVADYAFKGDNHTTSKMPDGSYGRNLRSVWQIATQPTPFAHFATYPEKLVEPCIKAGTSARGVCPECGAPWGRAVAKSFVPQNDIVDETKLAKAGNKGMDDSNGWGDTPRGTVQTKTTGWQPTCECFGHIETEVIGQEPHPVDSDVMVDVTRDKYVWDRTEPQTQPCTVLDPFHGSGTTGIVALRLGRAYVGVDISDEYLETVSRQRLENGVQIGFGL